MVHTFIFQRTTIENTCLAAPKSFLSGGFEGLKGIAKSQPQHLPYQALESILDIEYSFTVTRNPFSRLASEFRYRPGKLRL